MRAMPYRTGAPAVPGTMLLAVYYVLLWGMFFVIFDSVLTSIGARIIRSSRPQYKITSLGFGLAAYAYVIADFLGRHP